MNPWFLGNRDLNFPCSILRRLVVWENTFPALRALEDVTVWPTGEPVAVEPNEPIETNADDDARWASGSAIHTPLAPLLCKAANGLFGVLDWIG